jgi:hypothetical protein
MALAKDGRPIEDLLDWEKRAGPKTSDQWRAGRSAMEVAKCWLAAAPGLPSEVIASLAGHPAFGAVLDWTGEPEARLPFDSHRGEPRNADLVVFATDRHGPFVLAVEAKADEPFGELVSDALANAIERKLENPRSNGVLRVEQLAHSLLGPRQKGEAALGKLRYQLLTAAAGALRAGERARSARVVLLVQEFRTRVTSDAKHESNADDLNEFVRRLSHGAVSEVAAGSVYGPFAVPGKPLFDEPPSLFVGKVRTELRGSGA